MKEILEKLNIIHSYSNWRFAYEDESFNELLKVFMEVKRKEIRIELFENKSLNLSPHNNEQVDEFLKLSSRILNEHVTVFAKENPVYTSIVENDSFHYKRYAARIIFDELINPDEENTDIFFQLGENTIGYKPLTENLRFDYRIYTAISKIFSSNNR